MRESGKSITDFLFVIGGKVSTIAVVFLGGILLSRYSGPESYSAFITAITAVLLLDGIVGSPMDIAAVRFSALHKEEPERAEKFQAMSMQLKLISLIVIAALWYGWSYLSAKTSYTDLLIISIVACSLLIARSISTHLQIKERFRNYSMIDCAQGALRIALFLVIGLLGYASAHSYLLAYALGSILVFLLGVWYFKNTFLFQSWPKKEDRIRMFAYCGYSAGIISLGTLTGRSDILLLSSWFGKENIASYAAGSQLFMLAVQFALYVSVLTQPRVLTWAKEGKLRKLFSINAVLVLAGIGPVLFFIANPSLLQPLIQLVFGEGFKGTESILSILALGGMLDLLIVPILMMYVLQASPASAFFGEIAITLTFFAIAFFYLPKDQSHTAQQSMAWLAVGLRFAKLILYSSLFWVSTQRNTQSKLAVPL